MQTAIVAGIVGGAVLLAARSVWRVIKGLGAGGCGCAKNSCGAGEDKGFHV